jgi:hypothetical protein
MLNMEMKASVRDVRDLRRTDTVDGKHEVSVLHLNAIL